MTENITLTIGTDGVLRGLYSPAAVEIAAAVGPVTTRRASHVDVYADLCNEARWRVAVETALQGTTPSPDDWFADLSPVNGPVLGPFRTRELALAGEQAWLEANWL